MPVDESLLEAKIQEINTKLTENGVMRQTLKALHKNAINIQQVDVPDPTPEDPRKTKKEMPKDDDLGSQITPARRQEIYDKILVDCTELGI
jgi:hypothetical protein